MTTELSSTKVAGGTLRRIKHPSVSTKTDMTFALFTPAATVDAGRRENERSDPHPRERRVPPVRRDLLVRGTAAASLYITAFARLAQR